MANESENTLLINATDQEVYVSIPNNNGTSQKKLFCDDSDETTNYARLLCLIVEIGTECIKNYVLNHIPKDCDTIEQALQKKRRHFYGLKHKAKVVNTDQFNKLYPTGGLPINIASIDVSLWYILAKNLAETKINGKKFQNKDFQSFETPKGQGPKYSDVEAVHDVIRIRNLRNQLFHVGLSPKINNDTFELLYGDLSDALCRLGISRSIIMEYRTKYIDPTRALNYFLEMREQTHVEYQNFYKNEIKKKRHMLFGFVSVAFIVLLALIIASVVMFHFTSTWRSCLGNQKILFMSPDTMLGTISFMSRNGWHAKKPKEVNPTLGQKLPYVIISNSATSGRCISTDDCCNTALITQEIAFKRGMDDVAFNFLIGDDGLVYEARGWNIQSSAALGWNNRSISIGFMGTYITQPPSDAALIVTRTFLQYMVKNNVLASNFTIYALCQLRPFPYAPGDALYQNMKTWRDPKHNNTWRWRKKTGSFCDIDQPQT